MIRASKVLWGEGLFLKPQHFQRQDAYHEWRLAQQTRALHPYAWGLKKAEIDRDALLNGVLRFTDLQLIFPDTEQYSAPTEDELPAPLSLQDIPAGVSTMTFYAAVAPMRNTGSNYSTLKDSATGNARYCEKHKEEVDWYTQSDPAELVLLNRTIRIIPESEARDHLVSIPVCRLLRSNTGSYSIDSDYIPPCISIGASERLVALLRGLLDVLQAKVDALYGFHREPSQHVIEFRSGDIASFWLLHTASTAFAELSHYHHQAAFHPERLFEKILGLAGALMTFSKSFELRDLPQYDHNQPTDSFEKLNHIIKELLETVISTRYFSIALSKVKDSFYNARLDSEKITAQTKLYLGVHASMTPAELVSVVPVRFKIGAPDDVEKLVLSATSGIRLQHAPQVPGAIPVKPNYYYFLLEPQGPLYERTLKSQTMTIYAPAGIQGLDMELYALNQ